MLLLITSFVIAFSPGSNALHDRPLIGLKTSSSQFSFDSLNVRFIGNWPFGPSETVCYDEARQISFLGAGGGLHILNVSDPSNIVDCCDPIKTRGLVVNLYYDSISHRLYIASGVGGLEIWNVDDPISPLKIGSYNVPSVVCGVFVEGMYAYLACGAEGLRILDISTPGNPQEVGYCLTPDSAMDVVVSGNYAYVGDADQVYNGGGLVVIDISTPSNPQIVGYCNTPNFAVDVQVIDSYAYVADGEPGSGGLRIIDVLDPTNPYEVGIYRPDTMQWFTVCCGVYVRDTIAFVAYHNTGLFIVNVADATSPVELACYETPGQAMEVYVGDSCAYVADDEYGLCIIDISMLTNPIEIGHYDGYYSPNFVLSRDTLVFVSHNEEGLVRILNVANPSYPQFISQFSTTYGTDGLFISDSYLYVTDWSGLCIVDISDPLNPQMLGFCDLNGYPSGVFVVDTFAYVASFFSGLYIVNVANPTNPVVIGYCSAPYQANEVEVIGSYAYIANCYDGFCVIDISIPTNPHMVGSCNTGAYRIDVAGSFAYAASPEGGGLKIIDISNPMFPQEVGSYPGYVIDVQNRGSFTYITDHFFGLRIIDTSNPYAPNEIGFYKLPLLTAFLDVSDSLIYVGGWAGLQIFESISLEIVESQVAQKLPSLCVAPNLICKGTLRISVPAELRVDTKITVYNCLGQKEFVAIQFIKSINRGISYIEIPIKNLTAGVHFIEIITPLQKKICKFIVIN